MYWNGGIAKSCFIWPFKRKTPRSHKEIIGNIIQNAYYKNVIEKCSHVGSVLSFIQEEDGREGRRYLEVQLHSKDHTYVF